MNGLFSPLAKAVPILARRGAIAFAHRGIPVAHLLAVATPIAVRRYVRLVQKIDVPPPQWRTGATSRNAAQGDACSRLLAVRQDAERQDEHHQIPDGRRAGRNRSRLSTVYPLCPAISFSDARSAAHHLPGYPRPG